MEISSISENHWRTWACGEVLKNSLASRYRITDNNNSCLWLNFVFKFAPFKPENKKSLAERAKSVGLDNPAQNILRNSFEEDLSYYVKSNIEGLKSLKDVQKGVINIIASIIANDTEVLGHVRYLYVF